MLTSNEQARADAIADAETLRRAIWDEPLPIDGWDGRSAPDLGAVRCGMSLDLTRPFSAPADVFARDARLSAREAFAAVPGLRG